MTKQITCNFCGDTYPDFDVAHVCSKGPYAPRLKPKMNEELIQKLVDQCVDKRERHGTTVEVLQSRKFAELIVRECGVALSPMLRDMVSRGQAYDLIKQHFGVEE